MMATLGCMRDYLTRMVFVGVLGMALGGATLMVSPAAWADGAKPEIKADVASPETPMPYATYDESQPSADSFKNHDYLKFRPGAEKLRIYQAMLMYEAEDYGSAYDIFKEEAEAENPHAQFMLARIYDKGLGRATKILEALNWYRLAASNGHIVAYHNLGVIFVTGSGVPENYRDAVAYFKFAAERCYTPSQYGTATALVRLPKEIRDYSEVHMWLEIAAFFGYDEAKSISEQLHKLATTSHEFKRGKEKAQEWFKNHSCE